MNEEPLLVIDISVNGATECHMRVAGELDMATAARLRHALTDRAPDCRVLLDLSGLSFCDSSGLSAMVAGHRHLARGELVLTGIPRHLQKILDVTGLSQVFTISAD